MSAIAPSANKCSGSDNSKEAVLGLQNSSTLARFKLTEDDMLSVIANHSSEEEDDDEDPDIELIVSEADNASTVATTNIDTNHTSEIGDAMVNSDPAAKIRGRPSACVFVASLSSNLSDEVLCESVTAHFKQWGDVILVKVLRDPANRPYAFVQYRDEEDANKAILEGQHSILNGRTVRCEKARVNRTLYLQSPKPGMTQSQMKVLLNTFGEVERLVAVNSNFNIIDSVDTLCTNWFAKFVYRQEAIGAFANLKTKERWFIEWAQNLEDGYSSVPEVTIDKFSIFVGHLDSRITKEELVERFEQHGEIKEAILVSRPMSNFAFIKFKTREAAASSVERENHSMFKFKTIHVQYREMYNNYTKKFSNENGFKLNLAPPPVNFKKRNSSYHVPGMKSVNFTAYDSTSKYHTSHHQQQQQLKRSTYGHNHSNHNNDSKIPKERFQYLQPQQQTSDGNSPIQSDIPGDKLDAGNDELIIEESIEDDANSNGGIDERENNTHSAINSAVPKSAYTYTTVEAGDGQPTVEFYPPATPGFQNPFYYYYYPPGIPNKKDLASRGVIPPPPTTNGPFYYSYPSYTPINGAKMNSLPSLGPPPLAPPLAPIPHAEASAGTNTAPMYPYYFYYNPIGSMSTTHCPPPPPSIDYGKYPTFVPDQPTQTPAK